MTPGTKCFDGPEKRHRGSSPVFGRDNYNASAGLSSIVLDKAADQAPRPETYEMTENIRTLLLQHVRQVLQEGALQCRPFEAGGQYSFFDYTITKD